MTDNFKLHPIQLLGIQVKELFIRVNGLYETQESDEGRFQIGIGHSDFDINDSTIDVGLFVRIGQPEIIEEKDITTKFDLKIHLLAKFTVDQERFPMDKLEHWAEHNAPLILYPYIREHVHALTIRAGIAPILLPLMEIPTISVKGNRGEIGDRGK